MEDHEEGSASQTVAGNLYVSPIAAPLLAGKEYSAAIKLVKNASQAKAVRRGVPDICKAIRKGLKGVVIIAADVYPVEVFAHLPIICEEKRMLYAYVPSRQVLGHYCISKKAATAVFVIEPAKDADYKKYYDKFVSAVGPTHPYLK